MTIKDLLQRDPKKPLVNQGQARITDKRDERADSELQEELKSFVCEGQYADGIARIVESFLKNLGHTSQQAAWVSGFYGSGKSHVLKMLAHLWADTSFPDGSTARSLVPGMPEDLRDVFRELDTAGRRSGGLLSAAGSLPSGSTDLVRQTVLSVLLRGVGLPDLVPQAEFCLWLHDQGYLEAVRARVQEAGKRWDSELNNLYVSGVLAQAILASDPDFASSEKEARKTIREQFPKRDTDITTSEFLSLAKRALKMAGRDGRLPCTAVIMDEVQGYIGDSNDRSTLVSEVAEALSKEMDSHIIVVGAGQSALTGVRLLQRLMDRFTIRVPLSDTDVETVTRKVLLLKHPTAVAEVQATLDNHAGEVSRQLQGTKIGEIASDRHTIVDDYPLLPVRRRFWEHCFRQIDAAGTSSQLRSQLRIIHDAIEKVADRPVGAVIPGDELFDALAPEMVNTGVLLREINEKIIGLSKNGRDGDPLARRICGLVFLIGRLPRDGGADMGVRATKAHLSDLLVDDLQGDNGKLRNDVEAALDRLVAQGGLMRVEDEFRLQTREGSEWDREFRNRQTRLGSDEADLQIKRDTLLYAEADRVVRAQRVLHGAAKEARPLIIHREQTGPPIAGDAITVWIRDGWSTSEKQVVDDARRAGPDSPIVFVFIPRANADEVRKWIIDAAAAEETIGFKGVPTTPEGVEARRSIESRRDIAIRNRSEIAREIVGNAKVFQGGGTEQLQLTVDAKLKDAADASLIRLFPRFKEADSAAWGTVIRRAREGADQPFGPVGHTGATEQHPVCQEVLAQVAAGKTGTDVRRVLEVSPFGWPRDAIDAALIALHRSQHLRVTLNGAVVAPGQLDQNKIARSEFRVESEPPTVTERLQARALMNHGGLIACRSGEEVAKAPEFLTALGTLASSAGGPAPLPVPPKPEGLESLVGLTGNELVKKLAAKSDAWKVQITDLLRLRDLAAQRRPAWEALERLARHSKDVPETRGLLAQIEAVRASRLLLAPSDPVTSLRAELTKWLRQQVTDADHRVREAHEAAVTSLATNATWLQLDEDRRRAILAEVGLVAPGKVSLSTEDAVLATLDARPLSARAADADAIPRRAQRALEQAAKILEPTVRSLAVEARTLRTEEDVRDWLTRTEAQLMGAVKLGPVLVS